MRSYHQQGIPIVYVDESGFADDMPRLHGYATKGVRCFGVRNWHARGRLNAIGAIVNTEFVTLSLFDSTIDSDTFYAWIVQDLLPKLPKGAVIVMDNARFHKRQDILERVDQAQMCVEFLPTYSPDLNPIEHKWAQAKAWRRKYRCTTEHLFQKYFNYDVLL